MSACGPTVLAHDRAALTDIAEKSLRANQLQRFQNWLGKHSISRQEAMSVLGLQDWSPGSIPQTLRKTASTLYVKTTSRSEGLGKRQRTQP